MSRFLSSFKLTLGNRFADSVIHIDYDHYCYSHRIRRLFVFQLAKCYVSLIPAKGAYDRKFTKILKRTYKIKKFKHKKILERWNKKTARSESCFDNEIVNIFDNGKEIND